MKSSKDVINVKMEKREVNQILAAEDAHLNLSLINDLKEINNLNSKEMISAKTNKLLFKNKINSLAFFLISFTVGIASISDFAVQYFLKDDLKLQPGNSSKINSIALIPWSLKPLLGLLTDLVPLFGFRRKFYIIFSGLLNILTWLYMSYYVTNVTGATLAMFTVNLCLAFSSVIGEALVIEISQTTSKESIDNKAKDNISSYFIIKDCGILISSYLKGYLVDIMTPKHVFILAAFVPSILIIAGILINEDVIVEDFNIKDSKENNNNQGVKNYNSLDDNNNCNDYNTDNEKIKERKSLFKQYIQFISEKQVFVPLLFLILYTATPSYDDPYFYFLTNDLKFSGKILGQISFISSIFAILGIFLYKSHFKHVSFAVTMTVGSVIYFFFSFLAFCLASHISVFGISNYYLALFSSLSTSLIGEFISMPMLALACVLCPKNLEATSYSTFMAAMNLGSILSFLQCNILTNFYGITSNDFTNLPKLVIVCNIVGLFPLILLCFMNQNYFNSNCLVKKQNQERE